MRPMHSPASFRGGNEIQVRPIPWRVRRIYCPIQDASRMIFSLLIALQRWCFCSACVTCDVFLAGDQPIHHLFFVVGIFVTGDNVGGGDDNDGGLGIWKIRIVDAFGQCQCRMQTGHSIAYDYYFGVLWKMMIVWNWRIGEKKSRARWMRYLYALRNILPSWFPSPVTTSLLLFFELCCCSIQYVLLPFIVVIGFKCADMDRITRRQ